MLLLSLFLRVRLCATHRRKPTRLPRPWDFPGKNTGVGCHVLLQCMKVKSEREVAQSCPTLSDRMDCSLPGSSVHGIFQARVLEWGAIAFSGIKYYSQYLYFQLLHPCHRYFLIVQWRRGALLVLFNLWKLASPRGSECDVQVWSLSTCSQNMQFCDCSDCLTFL